MRTHLTGLYRRLRSRSGQAMPEYAVIAAAIIVAAYAIFQTAGTHVNALMQQVVAAF